MLLRAAPHIIRPLTFVLPHSAEQRPAWMIRLGLFLYDHLGGRQILEGSTAVRLGGTGPMGSPLQPEIARGFTYSDCRVDDSRLVVLNAIDAVERGATVLTRTECRSARRNGAAWDAEIAGEDGAVRHIRARALVNAAGPWVSQFLEEGLGVRTRSRVRLVKGSHIVVPQLYPGDHAYILQNDDKRIVFVIPYQDRFSLIGTTDVAFEGDPASVRISDEETDYLCRVVDRYFQKPIGPSDVVWAYAGVRPLYDDASANVSAVTRDYVFDLDAGPDRAPLLSVFGGKLTTYRRLAEHALEKLRPVMGFTAGPWTGPAHLPGGDIEGADLDGFLARLEAGRPWLPAPLAERYGRAYGTRVEQLLDGARERRRPGPGSRRWRLRGRDRVSCDP